MRSGGICDTSDSQGTREGDDSPSGDVCGGRDYTDNGIAGYSIIIGSGIILKWLAKFEKQFAAAKSADIDGVSGATVTSKGAMAAVLNALDPEVNPYEEPKETKPAAAETAPLFHSCYVYSHD
ncbi:MAG: FMN-binding protein [Hungatella sp.]|nr:FMN-binding protein [Hungatella sp.]